jgi:hypothetical protein
MTFTIDKATGTLTLPDGRTLGRGVSQAQFKSGPTTSSAPLSSQGSGPWVYYRFPNGAGANTMLLVSPQFSGDAIERIYITVDLDPDGPKDWAHYSLKTEAATKRFHDLHLEKMFGAPTKGGPVPDAESTLEKPLRWLFEWGEVASLHDTKGGGTSIVIFYK